ncbi:hypothetical protein SAMN05444369_103115 [Capnocytophaga haemolytica]|jgi:membrane protein|uniref:Uncharacterized protein n=1 Tax=Capnocytophaga haemolytica TaxID=45243 RepID=A0AAX2H0P7_9FLAO|nr:hypothetical protein [Capnocytophaga haemolytica]AMD85750.1 hypothetical protein AXF12_09630 [Capnocytophaga haemolytica]SFN83615.1 hypothetical protein SAMN05444369_103115 [Capnocytophaga haemolytica]SNV16058.1 Uncharacterised protein [Capnocytophaga haemolytica]
MYKIAKYGALALGAISVILWLVLSMSDAQSVQEFMNNASLQWLFILMYVLLAIAIIAVVVSALINILASPKALKKTLIYTGGFIVILLLSYVFSSGNDATEKWVGAGLIAFYILALVAVGALVAANVKKALMR